MSLRNAMLEEDRLYLTALHEAAHVVTAYLSRYHFITDAEIISAGIGNAGISMCEWKLNKEKLRITYWLLAYPEFIKDRAIIVYSGLEAEKKYCIGNSCPLDTSLSQNDYAEVDRLLEFSDSVSSKDEWIELSRQSVYENWSAIELLAENLTAKKFLNKEEITEILDKHFCNHRQTIQPPLS